MMQHYYYPTQALHNVLTFSTSFILHSLLLTLLAIRHHHSKDIAKCNFNLFSIHSKIKMTRFFIVPGTVRCWLDPCVKVVRLVCLQCELCDEILVSSGKQSCMHSNKVYYFLMPLLSSLVVVSVVVQLKRIIGAE